MTKIEWMEKVAQANGLKAESWNPIAGCEPEGEGCRNCWAAELMAKWETAPPNPTVYAKAQGLTRRTADGRAVFAGVVRAWEPEIARPLKARKGRAYFAPSMADLGHRAFAEESGLARFRRRVMAVILLTPRHLYLMLTKRPAALRLFFSAILADTLERRLLLEAIWEVAAEFGLPPLDAVEAVARLESGDPIGNLWLGTSVYDQSSADRFLPELQATPAALRFVSYEPALAAVDWTGLIDGIGLLIVGAEKADKARMREMKDSWAEVALAAAERVGAAAFHKQAIVAGHKVSLPRLNGRVYDQVPTWETSP